jgi:hypothetical protein
LLTFKCCGISSHIISNDRQLVRLVLILQWIHYLVSKRATIPPSIELFVNAWLLMDRWVHAIDDMMIGDTFHSTLSRVSSMGRVIVLGAGAMTTHTDSPNWLPLIWRST